MSAAAPHGSRPVRLVSIGFPLTVDRKGPCAGGLLPPNTRSSVKVETIPIIIDSGPRFNVCRVGNRAKERFFPGEKSQRLHRPGAAGESGGEHGGKKADGAEKAPLGVEARPGAASAAGFRPWRPLCRFARGACALRNRFPARPAGRLRGRDAPLRFRHRRPFPRRRPRRRADDGVACRPGAGHTAAGRRLRRARPLGNAQRHGHGGRGRRRGSRRGSLSLPFRAGELFRAAGQVRRRRGGRRAARAACAGHGGGRRAPFERRERHIAPRWGSADHRRHRPGGRPFRARRRRARGGLRDRLCPLARALSRGRSPPRPGAAARGRT